MLFRPIAPAKTSMTRTMRANSLDIVPPRYKTTRRHSSYKRSYVKACLRETCALTVHTYPLTPSLEFRLARLGGSGNRG